MAITGTADGERETLLPRTARNENGNALQPNGQALKTDHPTSSWCKTKRFLNADVDTNWTSLPLIITFFISGIIDSGSYNAYRCFTSMQTGNTIFAALGISDLPAQSPPLSYTKSLTAIANFLLGSLAFATFHRRLGERKRWTLALSALTQALLILLAAILIRKGRASDAGPSHTSTPASIAPRGLPNDPGFPWIDLIPIAVLSFQAAGKVLTSRMVSQSALPVIVLTTMYCDLLSDPALWSAGLAGNAMRNKRVLATGLYFAGAVVGGAVANSVVGFSGGLAIAALLQGMLALGWVGWWEDAGDEEHRD